LEKDWIIGVFVDPIPITAFQPAKKAKIRFSSFPAVSNFIMNEHKYKG
jgi:hypothetical protein